MRTRTVLGMIALWGYCVIAASGCAGVKECAKGFAGISTRVLEEGRKEALTMDFDYDYPALYARVKEILERTHSYIYAQNEAKHMIAFYVSEWDTTAVGVFFEDALPGKTRIQVSSPSTYAKEVIAGRISSVLEGKTTLDELEAKINAKEKEESESRDQQSY